MKHLKPDEQQLLIDIVTFYRDRHMSVNNPQQKDIDSVIDKIVSVENSDVTNAGNGDSNCDCSCHRFGGTD